MPKLPQRKAALKELRKISRQYKSWSGKSRFLRGLGVPQVKPRSLAKVSNTLHRLKDVAHNINHELDSQGDS